MSAFGGKADMMRTSCHIRFCDIDAVTQRPQDTVSSVLDYLGLGLL